MNCKCGKELTKVPEHLADCADWCCNKCATRKQSLILGKKGGELYEDEELSESTNE